MNIFIDFIKFNGYVLKSYSLEMFLVVNNFGCMECVVKIFKLFLLLLEISLENELRVV